MQDIIASGLATEISRFVRRAGPGEVAVMRHAGWGAVPMPSGAHLSVDDQARVLALCASQSEAALWAVPLEPLREMTEAVRVEPSGEGLRDFNRQFSFYDCALVGTSRDGVPAWMMACFTDDYLIALGPEALLPALCGLPPAAAFRAFATYAQDPEWPPRARRLLLAVCAAVLRYAETQPGSAILVPDPQVLAAAT